MERKRLTFESVAKYSQTLGCKLFKLSDKDGTNYIFKLITGSKTLTMHSLSQVVKYLNEKAKPMELFS